MNDFISAVFAKYNMVTADFKTAERSFQNQGVELPLIQSLFEKFKVLRDRNKLSGQERNIDYWSRKNFFEFEKRLKEAEQDKSETEVKKGAVDFRKKVEGAKVLVDTADWAVFKVETNKAASELSQGTQWCLRFTHSDHWDSYYARNNIYFILSKTRSKDDKWYKVALLVDETGKKTYWDATNKIDPPPSELGIPSFDTERPEVRLKSVDGKWYGINNLAEGFEVDGDLDLSKYMELRRLPLGLKVKRSLNLSGTKIRELPRNMSVGRDLYLNDCTALREVPKSLEVGGQLSLEGCTLLTKMPLGLKVDGNLDLSRCTALKGLPEGFKTYGDLIMRDCPQVKSLPAGMTVFGLLSIEGTPIKALPDDLQVTNEIYVDDPAQVKCVERLKKKLRKG